MRCLVFPAVLAASAAWAGPTFQLPRAGLQPDELGIVVREGDSHSEAIAELYRQARGIPAENIVRVPVPLHGESVAAAEFAAIKARVDERLPARVQATLLTWVQPSRVAGACAMSITSAFAFGYDERRCSLGDRTGPLLSPYFDSDSTRPWDDFRMRPSMMLGARTVDEARKLIDRGRQADGSRPPGDGYLVNTSDAVRSLRWPDFRKAAASPLVHFELVDRRAGGGDALTGRTGVLFYFTGLARTKGLATNSYRPGAVGDSLTSYGGVLAGSDQTSVLEWLQAGLTGSYGTVEEPFAHEDKFPRVSVLTDHYLRGATLVEAYWKSVVQPGQGLFVGEPLARPFDDRPRWEPGPSEAVLVTRVLRADRRYPVLHRASPEAPWVPLAMLTGGRGGDTRYPVPVGRAGSGEVRVSAVPCPDSPRIAALVRGDPAPLPPGRARQYVYQVEMLLQPAPLGCAKEDPVLRGEVLASPLGDAEGVSVRAGSDLPLAPGVPSLARVEVQLAASVNRAVPVALAWREQGAAAPVPLGGWRIPAPPSDTPVPPLRIVEPGPGWTVGAARRGERSVLGVVVEADPGRDVARVHAVLRGALGMAPVAEARAGAPGWTVQLDLPPLAPGLYRLTVNGETNQGTVVATRAVLVQVQVPR